MSKKGIVKFVNPNRNQFFHILRKRVDQHFKENNLSKKANFSMVLKSIILLSGYIGLFVTLLLVSMPVYLAMLIWIVMGFFLAGIGMSVMHDANHEAYTNNNTLNRYIGYTINLLGGSVFNWKLQHNVLHHTYTNVHGMDEDIDDKLILKFSPHSKVKGVHKFQFIYAFLFYGILTLYWVLLKDFIQFARYTKNGVNPNKGWQNFFILSKIVILKVLYLVAFIFIPISVFGLSTGSVIWGFLLMHFVAGMVLTIIFQLAHTVEGTSHPLPNTEGNIENDWAIHQLNTTVNFSRKSKFLTWYLGGLNYQVEHHLFPRICHVHYPAIAPIVKETAEEFGIPYLENETFGEALKSHFQLIKKFGEKPENSTKKVALA